MHWSGWWGLGTCLALTWTGGLEPSRARAIALYATAAGLLIAAVGMLITAARFVTTAAERLLERTRRRR